MPPASHTLFRLQLVVDAALHKGLPDTRFPAHILEEHRVLCQAWRQHWVGQCQHDLLRRNPHMDCTKDKCAHMHECTCWMGPSVHDHGHHHLPNQHHALCNDCKCRPRHTILSSFSQLYERGLSLWIHYAHLMCTPSLDALRSLVVVGRECSSHQVRHRLHPIGPGLHWWHHSMTMHSVVFALPGLSRSQQ